VRSRGTYQRASSAKFVIVFANRSTKHADDRHSPHRAVEEECRLPPMARSLGGWYLPFEDSRKTESGVKQFLKSTVAAPHAIRAPITN
jgi:hypothetical protein